MTDDFERWVVTTDPEQLADLKAKAEVLGSAELGEYAMSLGLRPPHHVEGRPVSVEEANPPGYDGEPLLMWTGYFPSVHPDEVPREDDGEDSAALWTSIGVEVVDASEATDDGR
ncbi:hypothetical protein ACFQS3_06160 [Glycomyces mayteni]|uniref:Uncharacterized protein n=1 Tax=Glycomyces mayteni TaxID=543887 RepID=A0ABW2D751_9ACTN|nr:hypothetical protein GCM10025732_56580 [Glycomyces mayteni]